MSIFSELVPLGNLNSRNCFTWQLVILLMRRGRCGCRKTTTASSTSRHWRDALHPDRGGFVGGEGPHTTANWREYHGVVSQSEKMVLAGHGGGVRRECPRHPLIGFLVVIPKNVQATIDDSEFVLMRIRVHSPSESSVKIDIEANVTRPLAKAARISGFTTQGVYIESPGFSSANDEDEDSLRRPPDGSRLLVEDVHSDWKAGGSSADADASIATTGGLFVGTQQLRHGGGGGRRGIRTSRPVSRIYGVESRQMGTAAPPPDNLIGYMQFPDLSFESTNTQSMVFSTELNITDLETFNAFTSHLVAKGGALWKLHGITSVHAMGLTFRDIEFSKVLPIEGAKAAIDSAKRGRDGGRHLFMQMPVSGSWAGCRTTPFVHIYAWSCCSRAMANWCIDGLNWPLGLMLGGSRLRYAHIQTDRQEPSGPLLGDMHISARFAHTHTHTHTQTESAHPL
eukprot:GHVU01128600.1.p1 GENE.GHVU01128600.1~~GHVU01128600.1.p1  ORF type:complete len:453 (+),score=40.09 GHVU01128600.1:145-1503(+)